MGAKVGTLVVRRSIWIDAQPDDVWHEFESFERMRAWYGTGHTLVRYEPFVGGVVETDASSDSDTHGDGTSELMHHGFEALGSTAVAAENHEGFEGGWSNRQLIALRGRLSR